MCNQQYATWLCKSRWRHASLEEWITCWCSSMAGGEVHLFIAREKGKHPFSSLHKVRGKCLLFLYEGRNKISSLALDPGSAIMLARLVYSTSVCGFHLSRVTVWTLFNIVRQARSPCIWGNSPALAECTVLSDAVDHRCVVLWFLEGLHWPLPLHRLVM